MTTPFTIDELPIPVAIDAAEYADFAEMVEIRNEIEAAALGSWALSVTAEELLPQYQRQEYDPKRLFVALVEGKIVARGGLEWSNEAGTNVTWVFTEVLPAFRNRGIGGALFDHVEGLALASGRTVVQTDAIHTNAEGGARLAPPTGFGDVPADDPGARFLRQRGYTLEQVYRISVLDLPVAPEVLAAHRHEAETKAGPDYRVHAWTSPTPERWLDDLAVLSARMATDAPAGGLEIDEEVWDAARVRAQEERAAKAGRQHFTAAAEHVPSGTLVAFNGVAVPTDRTRPVQQGPTLVLKEHRGHRLGMLVKAANIQQLAERSPESSLIITDNAEENRPMLGVNEAVGFRAIGYEGAWKKTFSAPDM